MSFLSHSSRGNSVTRSRTRRLRQLDCQESDEYFWRIRTTYYRKRVSQLLLFASHRRRRLLSQKKVLTIVLMFAIALTTTTSTSAATTPTTAQPNYVVSTDGTTISALNTATGKVDFSGTDAAQVIMQAAMTNSKVLISAGTYIINHAATSLDSLMITSSNVELYGASGSAQTSNAAILKLANGADRRLLSITGTTNVNIHDLQIDGNRANQPQGSGGGSDTGIMAWSNTGLTVSNNYVHDARNFGIDFNGCTSCTAANNLIVNSDANGMQFEGSGGGTTTFNGNTIDGASDVGITVWGGNGVIVENNIIRNIMMNTSPWGGNDHTAMYTENNSPNNIFRNNTISNVQFGFSDDSSTGITVDGNTCYLQSLTGSPYPFWTGSSSGGTFSNNKIYVVTPGGSLQLSGGWTLQSNVIITTTTSTTSSATSTTSSSTVSTSSSPTTSTTTATTSSSTTTTSSQPITSTITTSSASSSTTQTSPTTVTSSSTTSSSPTTSTTTATTSSSTTTASTSIQSTTATTSVSTVTQSSSPPAPPSQYTMVRGTDGGIYLSSLSSSLAASSPSSSAVWTRLPGATMDGPTGVQCGGQLFLAVQGTDNGIYFGSLNTATSVFSGWTHLPGATLSGPGLAADSSCNLYMAVRGTDNGVYLNKYTSGAWQAWSKLPGATSNSPSVAVYSGSLWVAVEGTDHLTIWVGHGNLRLTRFSGWNALPGATPSGPRLTVDAANKILYLAVRGSDNRIYINQNNGAGWSGWSPIPTGATPSSPGIIVTGGQVYVEVQGTDNGTSLYITGATSGSSWSTWTRLPSALSISADPTLC